MGEPESQPLREVEAAALEEEVARLEYRIAQGWQLFALLGIVSSLFVGIFLSPTLGIWCALMSVVFLGWFSLFAVLLRRKRTHRFARSAAIAVESSIPWVFLFVLLHAQGAAYTLGSWVPPMLFCSLMVAWSARLRPLAPLAVGVLSGISYPAIYFLVLRDRIEPELAHLPLYQPTMQFTRGISLVVAGALAGLISQTLLRVFARAQRTVRAQDLFGKYRLGPRIAAGGMATVFRATYCPEGGFERGVAIKRIHPHLAQLPEFVASFRVEAALSARLVHPNIVQVFDFGRIDESYFLAMEYVDGLTLRELLRRARAVSMTLPASLCAYIARELLAGLAYSHCRARDAGGSLLRVVHRDLSPANVLLSRHGEVKITDFGVAKALGDAAVSETRTVAGHLAYMAPEQAGAQPIDERCDIFAVGVIVWELLSGESLFLRSGQAQTLVALMQAEIAPPSTKRKDLDPAWDPIVERALARTVDDRYRTAETMAADIAALPDARDAGAGEALARLVAKLETVTLDDKPEAETVRSHDTEELPTRISSTLKSMVS